MAYKTATLGDSLSSTTRADITIWTGEKWEPLAGQEVYDGSVWRKFKIGDQIYDKGTWYTLIVPEPDLPTRYAYDDEAPDRIFVSTVPKRYLDNYDSWRIDPSSLTLPDLSNSVYYCVSGSTKVSGSTVSTTTAYTRLALEIDDNTGIGRAFISDLDGSDSSNVTHLKSLNSNISFLDLRELTGLTDISIINSPYLTKLDLTSNTSIVNLEITGARLGDHFTMPTAFTNIDRLHMPDCELSGTLDISTGTAAASLKSIDLENNNLAGLTMDMDTNYTNLKYVNLRGNCLDYDALISIFSTGGSVDGIYTTGASNGVIDISYNPGTEAFIQSAIWTSTNSKLHGAGWTIKIDY
jgi:hypothetical protein